jgi:preprotein translocase subunit SecY
VVGFTFFYTDVMVRQQNIPQTLQRQGGFIPGIRPGKRTEPITLPKWCVALPSLGLFSWVSSPVLPGIMQLTWALILNIPGIEQSTFWLLVVLG